MTFQTLTTLFIFSSLIASSVFSNRCTNCRKPWREYGGHCYLLVTEKRRFQDAESYCQSLSLSKTQASHLMTVASEEENLFLKDYTADVLGPGHFALWIGLNRVPSRDFVWVDGSSATYRNFKPGEPSNGWGEDCVVLWYGEEWNDFGCSSGLEFVCKMRGRFSR